MLMFYATGVLGIVIGLTIAPPYATMMITFLGVINIGLGAFFTFLLLIQTPDTPDKRKKKRKSD